MLSQIKMSLAPASIAVGKSWIGAETHYVLLFLGCRGSQKNDAFHGNVSESVL